MIKSFNEFGKNKIIKEDIELTSGDGGVNFFDVMNDVIELVDQISSSDTYFNVDGVENLIKKNPSIVTNLSTAKSSLEKVKGSFNIK